MISQKRVVFDKEVLCKRFVKGNIGSFEQFYEVVFYPECKKEDKVFGSKLAVYFYLVDPNGRLDAKLGVPVKKLARRSTFFEGVNQLELFVNDVISGLLRLKCDLLGVSDGKTRMLFLNSLLDKVYKFQVNEFKRNNEV